MAEAAVEGGWAEADQAMPPIRVPRLNRRPLKAGKELQAYLSAYYSTPAASVHWQNRMVAKNRGKLIFFFLRLQFFFFKFGFFFFFVIYSGHFSDSTLH